MNYKNFERKVLNSLLVSGVGVMLLLFEDNDLQNSTNKINRSQLINRAVCNENIKIREIAKEFIILEDRMAQLLVKHDAKSSESSFFPFSERQTGRFERTYADPELSNSRIKGSLSR